MWVDSGAAMAGIAKAFVYVISSVFVVFLLIIIGVHLFIKYKGKTINKPVVIFGIIISSLIYFIGFISIIADIGFLTKQLSSLMIWPVQKVWIFQAYTFIIKESILTIILGILPIWYFYNQYRISKSVDIIKPLKKSLLIFGIPAILYFSVGNTFIPTYKSVKIGIENPDYDPIECRSVSERVSERSNYNNTEEYIDDLQREKKVCNKLNYENVKKLAGINVGWTSIFLLSVMLTSSVGIFIFRDNIANL